MMEIWKVNLRMFTLSFYLHLVSFNFCYSSWVLFGNVWYSCIPQSPCTKVFKYTEYFWGRQRFFQNREVKFSIYGKLPRMWLLTWQLLRMTGLNLSVVAMFLNFFLNYYLFILKNLFLFSVTLADSVVQSSVLITFTSGNM